MTFRHWAGVSSYTLAYALAETCVFDKQSLGPLYCGHVSMAPLLPKLRGHFAEFLNKGFSARLRILSSPTCVGLRYGRYFSCSGFSWQCGSVSFSTCFRSASRFILTGKRICLLSRLCACTPHQLGALTFLLRPHFLFNDCIGTGISTCCPSTTLFSLALGPDLP